MFPSSSCLLVLLLFSVVIHQPCSATRILHDGENAAARASFGRSADWVVVKEGGEHVPRVELHEVHSGPNPISNSDPMQVSEAIPRGCP